MDRVCKTAKAKQRTVCTDWRAHSTALHCQKKELMQKNIMSKTALAKSLGIARATLYYHSRMEKKDWELKCRMEVLMREHPSYGSRSFRDALGIGREHARRVMHKYGIKPYRRRGRKWKKKQGISVVFPNLLAITMPSYPHHVWAADFTE